MRKLLLLGFAAPWLAMAAPETNAPAAATTPPAPIPTVAPRVLELELSVLRYKPATNEAVFRDFGLHGSAAEIVDTLRASGRGVDLLYHGTRELVLEAKSGAKFNATETRPVILIGKQGAAPPAIVYGLTMEVTVRPSVGDAFVVAWDGSLNWSPDLIDSRPKGPDAAQVLERAATAASAITAATGNSSMANIGLAAADLFKADNEGAIYELPVLKTVALSGSRLCHGGETIVDTTSAEASAKSAQIVFFVLNPKLQ